MSRPRRQINSEFIKGRLRSLGILEETAASRLRVLVDGEWKPMTQSQLSKRISGIYPFPLDEAAQLARLLKCKVDDFIP